MAGVSGRVLTDAVGVAWIDLDPSDDELAALAAMLPAKERAWAARKATPELRRRAVASLARRREVLAGILGARPRDVALLVALDGRREATAPGAATVSMSVSTCGGTGLVTVATGWVGCDVEDFGELPATAAFEARVATSSERAALAAHGALGAPDRQRALLRLWTRKEAYLKATGEGIGAGLARVDVPLDDGLDGTRWRPVDGGRDWFVFDLRCPRPELAAVVIVTSVVSRGAAAHTPSLRLLDAYGRGLPTSR